MRNLALTEFGIFIAIIVILVLNQFRISLQQLPEERTFRVILRVLVALVVLDVCNNMSFINNLLSADTKFIINLIGCAGSLFVPYLWNLYIHYKVFGSAYYFRKYIIPITMPLVMGILFCITRVYQITLEHNTLQTTEIWNITNIISIFYLILASITAFRSARKNFTQTGRRLEKYLGWIMIIPIIAIIIQTAIESRLPIVSPVFVLVFLHIYISQQNTLITLDYLTGLNNERRLNTFLRDKTADLSSGQRLFLLVITLDNINHIRRKFGKKKVNEILIAFADFLRSMMTNDSMFLAHLKKNSFAVVLEKKSWEETEVFCNSLVQKSAKSNIQEIIPWRLTFSINFSEFGKPGVNNVIGLLEDTKNNCFKPATALNANDIAENSRV